MEFSDNLLLPLRQQQSTIPGRSPIEEFYSDKSRIIYSSSFRRLQQKAQVFSLEPNSNVRTRLTHSLEVADIGRTLANRIGNELYEKGIIKDSAYISQIVAIVENACLLHDIGNPPFGHFGEAAIKDWANKNLKKYACDAGIGAAAVDCVLCDFLEFDGNPQGLRIVTRLHCERDRYGLNLTYPTLLCGIKYPRKTGDKPEYATQKKAGYFLSENDTVRCIIDSMGLEADKKYPFAYIMEAADDISYCLSDISDGIEKGILSIEGFLDSLNKEWSKEYSEEFPLELPTPHTNYFNMISVKWSRAMVDETVKYYVDHFEEYLCGEKKDILSNCNCGKAFETIKVVSRKKLYRSIEAERIELSGYSVITGLLDRFGELLKLRRNQFEWLTDEKQSPQDKGIDLQWRIYNRLSPRMIKSYKMQIDEYKSSPFASRYGLSPNDIEWWLRAHMIIDHISGMTDGYALELYKILMGAIRI